MLNILSAIPEKKVFYYYSLYNNHDVVFFTGAVIFFIIAVIDLIILSRHHINDSTTNRSIIIKCSIIPFAVVMFALMMVCGGIDVPQQNATPNNSKTSNMMSTTTAQKVGHIRYNLLAIHHENNKMFVERKALQNMSTKDTMFTKVANSYKHNLHLKKSQEHYDNTHVKDIKPPKIKHKF